MGSTGSPPENDNFADATTLSGTSGVAVGTTRYGTREAGEPTHDSPGTPTVWYAWSASQTGALVIPDCSGASEIAVYTGSTISNLTQRSSFSCGSDTAVPVTAGEVLRLAVVGSGGGAGFSFSYQFAPRPANDNFSNSQALAGSTVTTSGTTIGATSESNEPVANDSDRSATVWYHWTAPVNGVAQFDVCDFSDDYSRDIGIFTGSTLTGLNQIAGAYCQAGFQATAGTTYRIVVAAETSLALPFTIAAQIVTPPPNDSFSNSELLTGAADSASGTLTAGSTQAGEPDHSGAGADSSVWYRWTAPQTATLFISACDEHDRIDAVAVYTGTAVSALSEQVSGRCSALVKVVSGTEYRIAVAGDAVYGRSFDLSIEEVATPANDDFSSAETITGTTANGTTSGATRQTGEPSHGAPQAAATVWYRWVATGSGNALIDACSADNVESVAVYSGSSLGGLASLGEGDCQVQVPVQSGQAYYVAVASYAGWWGPFTLEADVVHPPANDNFVDAEVLSGPSPSSSGSTTLATRQAGEPSHNNKSGSASVWYSWTAPQSGVLMLTVCGDFDTVVAVYTGSTVSSLSPVASNDDSSSGICSEAESQVIFNVTAGTTYRIAVDGYSSSSKGDFDIALLLGSPPANYGLTVSHAGTGTGVVSSSPAGISCGSTCSASFTEGTVVTLTASPEANSLFDGWSAPCSGTGSCQVTMSQARNVTANFSLKPGPGHFSLTVSKTGTGSGVVTSTPAGINCGATCSAEFNEDTVVTLAAAADSGSTFTGWSGACLGSEPCEVAMTDLKKVTARFTAAATTAVPPTPGPAALTMSQPTPASGKLTAGKGLTFKVLVKNVGESSSGAGTVCASVVKSASRFIKLPSCLSFDGIAAGAEAPFSFRAKSSRKARGKVKITFRVNSDAGSPSASASVKIKQTRKKR